MSEGLAAFGRPRAAMPRRLAGGLLGLRLAALGALLAVAFELTLRIEQVTPAGRRLVVLVDRSASIDLADASEEDEPPRTRQARLEAAWQESADARVGWRDEGLVVDVRGFARETTPLTGDVADTLAGQPDGVGSDLARALTELTAPDPDRAPLAAVVVISDGLVAEDDATDAHVLAARATSTRDTRTLRSTSFTGTLIGTTPQAVGATLIVAGSTVLVSARGASCRAAGAVVCRAHGSRERDQAHPFRKLPRLVPGRR